jgi:hypothetical protein
VLLCERAFEEGFEVRDLLAAGIAAPALGEALRTNDAAGLCRLRLLWSLRPSRPWDPLGFAVTAFDVAHRPQKYAGLLSRYPDLLLSVSDKLQLLLCGGGVVFQETWIPEAPRSVEVQEEESSNSASEFVLSVDDRQFELDGDPGELVSALERWLRYHFGEFLPQSKHVLGWRSPGLPPTFRLQKTVACPECRRELLPRIGDLAVLVEEPNVGPHP